MQDIVTIEYDQMRRIAEEFQDVSETVHSVLSELQKQKDTLYGGDWVSDAATQFYKQMDDDALPGVQRLEASLQRSSDTCRDIIRTFEMAEEEAARCINPRVGLFPARIPLDPDLYPWKPDLPIDFMPLPRPIDDYSFPAVEPPDALHQPEWFELRDDRDGGLNGAKDADTLFINGIRTDHDSHMNGIIDVSNALDGAPVTGIYNKSDGGLSDTGQTFNDIYSSFMGSRFDGGNPAVDSAIQWIKDHPNGDIVVHSQGAAIISAALQDAARQGIDISGLNVTTLGGAGSYYPEGPNYNHIVTQNDPIPRILNPLNLVGYDKNDSVHILPPVDEGIVNLNSHGLQYYLDQMPNAAETARGFETEAIWRERVKLGEFILSPKAFIYRELTGYLMRGVSNAL